MGKLGVRFSRRYYICNWQVHYIVGESSEANCYDDIDAAYNFLTEKMQMKPENIVLYGRSLGSGPSCYLAERLQKENIQIGGLILQVFTLSQIKLRNNFILHFFSSSKIIAITYHFWNILPASP